MSSTGTQIQVSVRAAYHRQRFLVFEQAVDIVNYLSWVVVGDLTRPARPDAFCAVYQHHGDDGNVPLRLHLLVVIVQELEEVGVQRGEQQLSEWTVGNETLHLV